MYEWNIRRENSHTKSCGVAVTIPDTTNWLHRRRHVWHELIKYFMLVTQYTGTQGGRFIQIALARTANSQSLLLLFFVCATTVGPSCEDFGGIVHPDTPSVCCASTCGEEFCGAQHCENGEGGADACCRSHILPAGNVCGAEDKKAPCNLEGGSRSAI